VQTSNTLKHAAGTTEWRFLVTCKATIVDLPDLRLMVTRGDEFPSGIRAAWDRLESRLSSLKGRKFYGVVLCEESQMVYYAGVEPASEEEVSLLGLATMIVKGGKYARAKLLDWPNHTNKIGEIFAELMRDFGVDPKGPTVE
jgi:predicted transcriptional regulator YdeE